MLFRTYLVLFGLVLTFSINAKEWLIDVRTAYEYNREHVEGAINIEYRQIIPGALHLGIQKQDTVRLYCQSGRRANIARELLVQKGYQNVENLGTLQDAKKWVEKSHIAVAQDSE